MPKFGPKSLENLASADPALQAIFESVISAVDCSILCGHRGEAEQNAAFNSGKSKLRFPQSKHNAFPSRAVDAMPYPIRWPDISHIPTAFHEDIRLYARTAHFAGFVRGVAHQQGTLLRWGGDWNGNFVLESGDDWDMPHFELR